MAALDSVSLPPEGDTSWYDWSTAIDTDVRASVSGTGVDAIVALSQTAYDALSPKVATTLYVIV